MNTKQYLLLGLLVSCTVPHTTRPFPYKTTLVALIFAGATWNTKQKLEAQAKEGKTKSRLFEIHPYADAALVTLADAAHYVGKKADELRQGLPTHINKLVTKVHESTDQKPSTHPSVTPETATAPTPVTKLDEQKALDELNVANQAVVEIPVTEAAPVTTTEKSNK